MPAPHLQAVEDGKYKPEPLRSDLGGALEGRHVLLDPNEMTFGLLEDLTSGQPKLMLDSLSTVIVGGDLPKGTDRAGLRRLVPAEIVAVVEGLKGAFEVPKS